MLLQPKPEYEANVSVIPIVGLPGVGKSTLAKYVYDDVKVDNHFDLKIWIRASQITEEEIIQEIVESCTNSKSVDKRFSTRASTSHSRFWDVLGCQSIDGSITLPGDGTSKSEADISKNRLRKEIKGKLFLLILDDACIITWQRLKNLLAGGARGSHILVTTRSREVADLSKTESVNVYQLQGLNDEHSESLFRTFAFGQQSQSEHEQKIGNSIAKICKGNPLTIKVAASLLYAKNEDYLCSFNDAIPGEEHDEHIMKHVLNFSFTELPTRLKVCLGYCSLFPENHIFNKHDLISLWTAQGFVEQQQGKILEETSEKYFLELSRRCFFEDVSTDDLGNIMNCKMHPIIHSLASQHAVGVVNMNGPDSSANQVLDSECKHVSFTYAKDPQNIASSKTHAQNLRTLISVKEPDCDTVMAMSVCDLLLYSFKSLRVLDFHSQGIKEIPVSIGKLIHLRYLDLSENNIVTLPKSITELHNLQTLKLNACMKLEKLPGNFGELVNLKRFEVDECNSLTSMPLGLEKLSQLVTLSRFIVNKNCSTELQVLSMLTSLRGRLAIELSGEWATNIPSKQLAELDRKVHLEKLKISWAKTESKKSDYQQLLEQLQPNSNLKSLWIEGYKGDYLPKWAERDMLTSLPNLVVISIEGCEKCKYLPPFGALTSLRRLTLRHMPNVQYVERETTSESLASDSQENTTECTIFYPQLEELTLHNFYKLEGWRKEVMITSQKQEVIRVFKRLTKLRLWNCPNLKSMPLFFEVLDLDLRNVNQKLLEECAKKTSTAIRQQPKNKSRIEQLQIKGCCDLKSFEVVRKGLGSLPDLKQLVIERCDSLLSLAPELKYLSSLERLEISSCKKLNLSDKDNSGTGKSSSKSWISRSIWKSPWTSLKLLLHLTLCELPKMETLPDGLQLVQSIRSLWIISCPVLRELPDWINSLTALQHLRINNCQGVKSLPEGIKEIKSLVKLEITECPDLMKRCKVHTGEDWHKIKHAWVLLHKSWRYGLMSEQGNSQKRSVVRETTDVKYYIVPVIAAEAII
ncbi:putative disease resistance protein RGA3 [Amaranthus tricolor]|uniref:putative disease resistance protein RGA3 n=1 Tax=Amaranthus tricolor TaxID=29722 RepID=UPI00258C01B5|nr:putative disease resistance protein RGA3 [Amaranthus tricolor]